MRTIKLALLDLGSAIPNNLQYINFFYMIVILKKKRTVFPVTEFYFVKFYLIAVPSLCQIKGANKYSSSKFISNLHEQNWFVQRILYQMYRGDFLLGTEKMMVKLC